MANRKRVAIKRLRQSIALANLAYAQNPTSEAKASNLELPVVSSVLVVLRYVNRDGCNCWDVLLTLRSNHLRFHRGLVCLPGRKAEPGEGFVECALREAHVCNASTLT